jgi:hypothetical protein
MKKFEDLKGLCKYLKEEKVEIYYGAEVDLFKDDYNGYIITENEDECQNTWRGKQRLVEIGEITTDGYRTFVNGINSIAKDSSVRFKIKESVKTLIAEQVDAESIVLEDAILATMRDFHSAWQDEYYDLVLDYYVSAEYLGEKTVNVRIFGEI